MNNELLIKICDMLCYSTSQIKKMIQDEIPIVYFYKTLINDSLTRREKKEIIYSYKNERNLELMKDNIWERYIGDKNFLDDDNIYGKKIC